MTAFDLYHDLIGHGFSLSVNGDKLVLIPSSQLTDNLRAQIRTYKPDLMALLAANDTQAAIDLDWRKLIYGISTEDLLYNHLLTCAWCHIEAAQYCLQGNELGKAYDELLQAYDDAQDKRQALSLKVDKAKIARSYR